MAKVFLSIEMPLSLSMTYVSLLECPVARITVRVCMVSVWTEPSGVVLSIWIAEREPSEARSREVSFVLNATVPPASSIILTMLVTTVGRTSLPTWGFASHKIFFCAPALTKVSRIKRWEALLVPVLSFPSENVPAPPSPNWMLLSRSSWPVWLWCSTAAVLLVASSPRSMSRGLRPALASVSAQNRPAHPAPTTTGRFSEGAGCVALGSAKVFSSASLICFAAGLPWILLRSFCSAADSPLRFTW